MTDYTPEGYIADVDGPGGPEHHGAPEDLDQSELPDPAPGYHADKSAVLRRLRRIEGQVRGLERMVEDDRYCVEVLDQVAAATRALQAVALTLVRDHLTHCVGDAVASGGDAARAKIDEASAAIGRLVRS
jgi:CsoR family transcriptional regulator, copper-sensing transcriptional repressor